MTESVEALFAKASGAPGAFSKDSPAGTIRTGRILALDVRQRQDMDGKPQFWDDGNPQEQIAITIRVGTATADDTGERRIWVKWWGEDKKRILEAVRQVGAPHLEIGGTLTARYDGEGEATKRGLNPPKLYSYRYVRPNATADLMSQAPAEPVQDAPWPDAPTAPVAPPAVQNGGPDPRLTAVKSMGAAGMSAAQISAVIPDLGLEAVTAILGLS